MSNQTHIDIVIDESGDGFTVEGRGFEGKGCSKVLGDIAKQLGAVGDRKKTSDYYKQPRLTQRQQQKGS